MPREVDDVRTKGAGNSDHSYNRPIIFDARSSKSSS